MTTPTPLQLLQKLLQFDTTNPPGNERDCILYIQHLLDSAGFNTQLVARDPQRPNLLARLPGRGDAPPLLWQGHVDVVTTAGQQWTHPPFAGVIEDGFIWGRGTLDMKGAVAMMVSALLKAKQENLTPAGDILLCVLADEEDKATYGARYLVENHPQLFAGVRYAIGEFGGFNLALGGKTFYPIQIAEKRGLDLRATFHGSGGHASGIFRGNTTMAKTAAFLTQLDQWQPPILITPAVQLMFNALADALPMPTSQLIRSLLNPTLAPATLRLLGARAAMLEPLLRHTINATIINGGLKRNVIPSKIELEFDVRLLPGAATASFINQLQSALPSDAAYTIINEGPLMPAPDMGMFDTLANILQEADPKGTAVPFVLQAVTDARFFAQLGIQTYGFTPLQFPPGINISALAHAADERIPVEAVAFGTAAFTKLIEQYRG